MARMLKIFPGVERLLIVAAVIVAIILAMKVMNKPPTPPRIITVPR